MSEQKRQNEDGISIPVPPVPVIIKLEDTPEDRQSNVPSPTSINVQLTPPLFCLPSSPQQVAKNEIESPKKGGGALGLGGGKSLLGADLLQKSASLAMPPPTSTTVKKARNLVNPGMSMVKWMKLQETRIRPPTRKKIPISEIAKHNSESDCWMVIRNCVYDVTEYLPYHPGGVPELMKGAGKDATALFNEVHRWVNYDSILKSCFRGYFQIDVGESFEKLEEDVEQKSLVLSGKQSVTLPKTDFSESDTDLVLHVDTGYNDELSDDNWCVSLLNRERLVLKVVLKPPELWMTHVKLLQSLMDDSLSVNFQNSFKRAVITIKKPSTGKWKSLGHSLQDNNKLMDSRNSNIDDYCIGTIVEKENLTQNVILIGVQVTSSSFLGIPVGFHLRLRLVDGNGPARKYTPVIKSILDQPQDSVSTQIVAAKSDTERSRRVIYFIIKIYPDGQLTREIGLLQVNSQLELGVVAGRYDPSFLSGCDTLALIAGGSGVTPFVRIADFLRKRSATYPVSRILLIFFNHSESDIIWRNQWQKLEDMWSAFHFFPVVSTPEPNWKGLTGRVDNVQLFESILLKLISKDPERSVESIDKSLFGKFKAMLCGSSGFNEAFVTMLKSQSIVSVGAIDEDVFIF